MSIIHEFDNMFDLMWKNMLDHKNNFNLLTEKINYPVDVYETDKGITFELAVVGIHQDDIHIEVENDILRVSYISDKSLEQEKRYLHKGIAKRSFDLTWKVSSKFDLKALNAFVDKGLLYIEVPKTQEIEGKKLTFKPKTKTLLEVKS